MAEGREESQNENGIERSGVAPLGRVGAPQGAEATSEEFHFWVPDDQLVEKTQLVYLESPTARRTVTFYGLVTEVFRRSRRANMLEETDRFDGRPEEEVPIESRGVTYAQVRVLASHPNILSPPREEGLVYPAFEPEARIAYGVEEMSQPMILGLIRNGGEAVAGPAYIDLDYLLGAMGGHMNVTGIAGAGTKSSFLMVVLHQLLYICRRYAEEHPEDPEKPQIRPIILNVKGFDLFWLDHWSSAFKEGDWEIWQQMKQDTPAPFSASFFAPQQPGSSDLPVPVGRSDVQPYSWSLEDALRDNLFMYLFSDSDREDDNFALLVADIERLLIRESRQPDGAPRRELRQDASAKTFQDLFDWFERGLSSETGQEEDFTELPDPAFERLAKVHHSGTLRRFYRRLRRIVYESAGIFRLDGLGSHPLNIRDIEAGKPIVVDINGLPDRHLQRFVVAALVQQAVDQQTGSHALTGMHYVFILDELNRFAPRGHSDPITQLIETVAAEMRSRGVILLGAQQQASLVSARVVENAAIRVLGRTGGHELQQDVFSFLPESLRKYVEQMGNGEKVVHQPSFREPMHVRVPRPPWAMRKQEASRNPPEFLAQQRVQPLTTGPRRLPPRAYEDLP
ncbi:MAG: ATP-binding protein [Candidatus Binatia bacterium]